MNEPTSIEISQEQEEVIKRFIAAFNEIDRFLRISLRASREVSFTGLVHLFKDKNPRWNDFQDLITFTELRNVIIHNQTNRFTNLAIPVTGVVDRIEGIRDALLTSPRVIPKFKREVAQFKVIDRLFQVLKVIHENSYSQFPVYNGDEFVGLLTENGITRWLANHSQKTLSLIETKDIPISEVLVMEENRKNYQFLSRKATELEAESAFVRNSALEALLITENGQMKTKLLGIITHWDILRQ